MTTTSTRAWIGQFSPDIHEKYSENLHRWLTRSCPKVGPTPLVYRHPVVSGSSYSGVLFIGWFNTCGCHPDDFVGCVLSRVLCDHRVILADWGDRSDFELLANFWDDYKRIGRCALDPSHKEDFLNAEGRFIMSEDGAHRECTWCGKKQVKHRREVQVTKVYVSWKDS